jgi:hypothetical protein
MFQKIKTHYSNEYKTQQPVVMKAKKFKIQVLNILKNLNYLKN